VKITALSNHKPGILSNYIRIINFVQVSTVHLTITNDQPIKLNAAIVMTINRTTIYVIWLSCITC